MRSILSARHSVALVVLAVACGGGSGSPQAAPPQSAAVTTSAVTDPRAALFVQKGCPQCHSISALGVKSPAEVGPDLTGAYDDVRTRFGVKLEEFMPNPTGTMQMVLSSMIQLSPAERDSIIRILKGLHEEREQRAEHGERQS